MCPLHQVSFPNLFRTDQVLLLWLRSIFFFYTSFRMGMPVLVWGKLEAHANCLLLWVWCTLQLSPCGCLSGCPTAACMGTSNYTWCAQMFLFNPFKKHTRCACALLKVYGRLYSFARTVISKHHKLNGFNIRNVLTHRVRCGQSWFLRGP